MKLEDLKAYKGSTAPQLCQRIAVATLEDGTYFTGLFDEQNGHWLTLPERDEVGYLDNINNKKVVFVEAVWCYKETSPQVDERKSLKPFAKMLWSDPCPLRRAFGFRLSKIADAIMLVGSRMGSNITSKDEREAIERAFGVGSRKHEIDEVLLEIKNALNKVELELKRESPKGSENSVFFDGLPAGDQAAILEAARIALQDVDTLDEMRLGDSEAYRLVELLDSRMNGGTEKP